MSLTKVKDGVSATSLDGLTDVELSALSDGDIIAYSSSSGKFENTAAGGGGGSYTDEQARDAVGAMLTDTATVDFTYDDAGDTITADVIPSGITVTDLSGVTTVAGSLLDDTSVGAMRTTLELGTAATSDTGDFAAAVHTHAASDIVSGTIATARLGSGTADSSTYLRGDGAWATVSGGAGASAINDLSDVTITTPASGQALIYNGSSWVNQTVAGGSYTDENAQDAIGGILTDTTTIDFVYNDAANTITAAVKPAGVSISALSGAGTMATQNANAVAITGGNATLTGGTFTDVLTTDVQATTSTGVVIRNSSGTPVALAGNADSTLFVCYGQLNVGTNFRFDGVEHIGTTGLDVNLVSGTAGISGNFAQWNIDGDVVDSGSSSSSFAAASHTHATTDITSGTFADARIAETNVTQHQAALSITEAQISDLGDYVVGPASGTDNAVVRFDSTTGKLVQNSGVIVTDSDEITGVVAVQADGSGGLDIRNSGGTDVAVFGAGAGTGVTFNGGVNVAGAVDLQSTTNARSATVAVSGTTKTLALTDENTIQECSNGSAQAITIPANASVAFPTGTWITFEQHGAGVVSITGATGVSINGNTEAGGGESTVSIAAQWGAVTFRKIGTDSYIAYGSL